MGLVALESSSSRRFVIGGGDICYSSKSYYILSLPVGVNNAGGAVYRFYRDLTVQFARPWTAFLKIGFLDNFQESPV
ncbi:hypothetical protein U1Q18_007877 [Sarracenia purpurea var. burkii]